MENDISNMFKEKNKDIFKNSLQLEMERNLDTLVQATNNCITLEINKVIGFLKDYFIEENIEYEEKKLQETVEKEKEKLVKIINDQIENKKNQLIDYFNNEYSTGLTIEKEHIEEYHNKIDEISIDILKIIEDEVKKEISENFTNEILNKYYFKNEDQVARIRGRIDALFYDMLTKRIRKEILFRDDSLKNMCKESYNKYLNLNQITT